MKQKWFLGLFYPDQMLNSHHSVFYDAITDNDIMHNYIIDMPVI